MAVFSTNQADSSFGRLAERSTHLTRCQHRWMRILIVKGIEVTESIAA